MSAPKVTGASPSGWFSALTAQPYLLLIIAPFLWGANFVVGKFAVGNIDPQLLVLGRWLGATLILLPFAIPHVIRDWPQIRAGWIQLAVSGILGFAVFNILIYTAALYTSGTNISIENAGIPIFVFIGNFIFFRVGVKPIQLAGLVLTFLGVIWVATNGEPARILRLDINLGDALVLAAVLAYAIYSLTLRYKPDIHWLSFIQVTAFFALLTSFVFLGWSGRLSIELIDDILNITSVGWLCVAFVMIFPSIIAQLSFARGVQLVGPNRASIFINLLPIFGTLLSILLLGERFEFFHFIAAALVILGILLSEYSVRRLK